MKTGELKEHTDLLALPDLSSSARSPRFKYQYTVNPRRARLDPDLILLLRVYTVDVDTKELVVIGSCFFEAFDDNQVRNSLPSTLTHVGYALNKRSISS